MTHALNKIKVLLIDPVDLFHYDLLGNCFRKVIRDVFEKLFIIDSYQISILTQGSL